MFGAVVVIGLGVLVVVGLAAVLLVVMAMEPVVDSDVAAVRGYS